MLISGAMLGLFAVVATTIVASTFEVTKETIDENERQQLLRGLNELVPSRVYDNDIFNDYIEVVVPKLERKGKTVKVYRARRNGRPIAVIMQVVAPNGYGGPIKMLVAIRYDGTLAGVRVISHRETPGLGDAIELNRSDWILVFHGKSLDNPGEMRWRVAKDGGVFDQFTGATITPRAVVNTVHNTLVYYENNRGLLFSKVEELLEEDAIKDNG
jgi:electron transport complex protein RnfG